MATQSVTPGYQMLGMLLLMLASPVMVGACGRGSITITNNEYKQMLIAISENVPEDPQLITRIREVFTDASSLLYQVTK